MKLKHLFFNALAVMAFAACSSEAEEIKPAEKSETATVEIDLEGEYNNGQTRALTFDGTEYPLFTHQTGVTDWKTHCFIRNEAGTVQFYALVDWTASVNSSTGAITLKIKDSKLTLQGSGGSNPATTATLPKAGERWYIAGIAGGGVLEANNTKVNFAYNQSLDASLAANQLRVPIAFGWTPFTIAKPVSERAPRIVVQFQPQGTLLNMYVNNKTNVNKAPLQAGMKVTSNALSQDGNFDYSLAASRTTYASAPKWDFTNASATTETFVRNINIAQNARANCYIWAMPRTTAPSGGFKTTVGVGGYTYFAEGSSTQKPATMTQTFQKGNTYMAKAVDVYRPYLPYEFLTEYNVATDGASFVTTHANDVSGYWNYTEALEKFSSITIAGKKYHLPTGNELAGIFGWVWSNAGEQNNIRFDYATSYDNLEEKVEIDGFSHTYTADYRSLGNQNVYALRLKSSTDNSRLLAVRYSYIPDPLTSNKYYLRISYRHLGVAGASTTITDVAKESFWASNTSKDAVFYFPASGSIVEGQTVPNRGYRSAFLSRSISDVVEGIPVVAYFSGYSAGVERWTASATTKYTIRLFKDEL